MAKFKEFLKRKNIVISAKRYGIDALSAMAQGLFCSLLIGTIIKTVGTQCGIQFLTDIGTSAKWGSLNSWNTDWQRTGTFSTVTSLSG